MLRRAGSVLCLFALSCQLLTISGCTPAALAAAPLVSVIIDQLTNRISQLIDQAQNAGDQLLIHATDEVSLALQNFKAAYLDSLDKTIDKVNPVIKGTIDQLTGAVSDLEKKTNDDAQLALAKAQQIVNTLPLSKTIAQVTSVSPQVISFDPSASAIITVKGNFIDSANPLFKPILQLANHDNTFQPQELETQEMKFLIPISLLIGPSGKNVGMNSLSLTLPYKDGAIFTNKVAGAFRLLVGTFPSLAGTVKIDWTEPTESMIREHNDGQDFYSDSHGDDIDRVYSQPPTPGWVVIAPAKLDHVVVEGSANHDWWLDNFNPNPPTPSVHCRTEHHSIGHSGKIHFRISFDEQKVTSSIASHEESFDLKWGNSRAFQVPAGRWVVHFHAFDGSDHDYTGKADDKYIHIAVDSGNLTISAPYFQDIKLE